MMRAFIDRPYGRVVFFGDKVYSVSIDRVLMHPELLTVPSFSEHAYGTLQEMLSMGAAPAAPAASAAPLTGSQHSAAKDHLVPAKDGCLIVSKLTPELRFNGRHDGKSIAGIRATYGELPQQVQSLISSGRLLQVSGAELQSIRNEHARIAQEKKDAQDTRRKAGRSVRRRDDVSDDGDDDSSPIKNAIPIRI